MSKYFMGLSLGQPRDAVGLAIIERDTPTRTRLDYDPTRGPVYSAEETGEPAVLLCRHIERFPPGAYYPEVIRRVGELMREPEIKDECSLAVDFTEAGLPALELFRQADLTCTPVIITGGESASTSGAATRLPKRVLVSTLQVLLQSERLRLGPSPFRESLLQELMNYRLTPTEASEDTYRGRDGAQSDLVLAVALACWKGRHTGIRFSQSALDLLAGISGGL
jgi:hypothetical protein